ncbi:protein kinase domain-containing protein [Actinoplanes sp. NPDC026623]|uniref:protein kinase domain-containing protein n=1 Tax=Actinoplanes sp. NPDC026623 TaxID=3155610 RepID=UPI0033CF52CE
MTDEGYDAPRTVLDAPSTGRHAAPGTTRDGAPGTTRDRAPGTTRDGAPATTYDARVPRGRVAPDRPYLRVNIPPALAERFDVDRELGSGGEADVLLVTDRLSREQRVVRLYRRQDIPLETEKLDRLCRADRKHLVGLLEYGKGEGYIWEILEYAAEGSLEELTKRRPGAWSPDQVLQVFDQLAPAIAYANSLGMVHRDIKPGNILIRSLQPLDLVLADFGLTKFLAATRHMGTTSRTSAYAPPEAISGQASRSWDWWSLGIVMVEMLTGLNPFQRPDGTWQTDAMILSELTTHDIDLAGVADARWQLLCRGLLTRAPEQRWGAEQTEMWRRGETPEVAEPARPKARKAGGGTYVFGGTGYDEPIALAAALRANWDEGRRLMAGRNVSAPPYLAFRDWLVRNEQTEAVRALDGGVSERPERGLMQVILALDPDSPPVFAGQRLDAEHLHALSREAMMNPQGRGLLELVFAEGILTICDGMPGCDGYALLDDRWHRSVEAARLRFGQRRLQVSPADLQAMLVQLLVTAFEGQQGTFAEAAYKASQDEMARRQQWFRDLAGERAEPATEAAQHAVIIISAPIAARQTSDQIAEADRQRIAHEQRLRFESRARIDRISPPIAVLCGVLAVCIWYVAPVAGPAAVYFGVRARRTSHRAASTWGIALGGIGVILFAVMVVAGLAAGPAGTGVVTPTTTP